MTRLNNLIKDKKGGAVVESTILFPIMIMIFAALVLLSVYLPVRATLQRATQYAATAIATEKSDTWLFYDENSMSYCWEHNKNELENVYKSLIESVTSGDDAGKAETIVRKVEESGISVTAGDLVVEYGVINYIIYKEIIVTATRTIPVAVNLSFMGFPKEIPITVTSTAIVQNGDEFVRNIDMAVNFVQYIDEKYKINEKVNKSKIFQSVKDISGKFSAFLGWGV